MGRGVWSASLVVSPVVSRPEPDQTPPCTVGWTNQELGSGGQWSNPTIQY